MTVGRTPSQTVGPFFAIGLCREGENEVVPGGSLRVVGRVLDGVNDPVSDALVEFWQPGADGTRWGRSGTDTDGRFELATEPPSCGYADVMVFARGLLRHLVTRCYFEDVADDAVLAGLDAADRATLIGQREGDVLRFDIHLQGDRQTVFFAV
jgi:protocatechuate 3,4-dioxygenase alpha subunit